MLNSTRMRWGMVDSFPDLEVLKGGRFSLTAKCNQGLKMSGDARKQIQI